MGESVSAEESEYENSLRRANWEAGKIDYLGKIRFFFVHFCWAPFDLRREFVIAHSSGGVRSHQISRDRPHILTADIGNFPGQDSFDNILKKINQTIDNPPAEVAAERERKRSVTTPQKQTESVSSSVSSKSTESSAAKSKKKEGK